MTGDDRLDTLLSTSLDAVDDSGFSARVAHRVLVARERREAIELFGLLAAFGIFLAVLPLTAITNAIETATLNLGSSTPVAMAVLAIVLTGMFARTFAD
jgi:hypothetical protein